MWKSQVAPLAGAWIEIRKYVGFFVGSDVAPLAGAWIEIMLLKKLSMKRMESLPLRERGLKCSMSRTRCGDSHVAPLAGAWIEIARIPR